MVCHTHILLKWWPQEIIGPSLTSHSYLVCVVRTFWKSTPLATFKYTGTVLWMILTRLYISPPRAYLSYNWKIMPFYHLHLLLHIPPVISGSHQSTLFLWVQSFLDFTYKWNHMIHVFLFLTRSIHVAVNGIIFFFLWLGSIPFYICKTSLISIHLSVDI